MHTGGEVEEEEEDEVEEPEEGEDQEGDKAVHQEKVKSELFVKIYIKRKSILLNLLLSINFFHLCLKIVVLIWGRFKLIKLMACMQKSQGEDKKRVKTKRK